MYVPQSLKDSTTWSSTEKVCRLLMQSLRGHREDVPLRVTGGRLAAGEVLSQKVTWCDWQPEKDGSGLRVSSDDKSEEQSRRHNEEVVVSSRWHQAGGYARLVAVGCWELGSRIYFEGDSRGALAWLCRMRERKERWHQGFWSTPSPYVVMETERMLFSAPGVWHLQFFTILWSGLWRCSSDGNTVLSKDYTSVPLAVEHSQHSIIRQACTCVRTRFQLFPLTSPALSTLSISAYVQALLPTSRPVST